jgi:adenosine deaminase
MCPLSNLKLKVQNDLTKHPLKTLMDKWILVTINSDDPAYFGWYIQENYLAIAEALQLSQADIIQLAKNSFEGSFLNNEDKKEITKRIVELMNE